MLLQFNQYTTFVIQRLPKAILLPRTDSPSLNKIEIYSNMYFLCKIFNARVVMKGISCMPHAHFPYKWCCTALDLHFFCWQSIFTPDRASIVLMMSSINAVGAVSPVVSAPEAAPCWVNAFSIHTHTYSWSFIRLLRFRNYAESAAFRVILWSGYFKEWMDYFWDIPVITYQHIHKVRRAHM